MERRLPQDAAPVIDPIRRVGAAPAASFFIVDERSDDLGPVEFGPLMRAT